MGRLYAVVGIQFAQQLRSPINLEVLNKTNSNCNKSHPEKTFQPLNTNLQFSAVDGDIAIASKPKGQANLG